MIKPSDERPCLGWTTIRENAVIGKGTSTPVQIFCLDVFTPT